MSGTLRLAFRLAVATSLVTAVGCAGSSSPVKARATAAPHVIGVALLLPMPAGTVTLSRDPNSGRVTIDFDMYGLALRSTHAVVIRSGRCSSSGGRIVAMFPDVAADPYGALKGPVKSRNDVAAVPATSHLDIELGPAAGAIPTPGSTRIACADIAGAHLETRLTLIPLAGQPSSGTVTLTYLGGGRVDIHIVVRGLAPGSVHAGHVHFGSCRQQSGVLFTLGNVSADAQGNVNSSTTLTGIPMPPSAHEWYADLHLAPVSGLELKGQPTLLFQPLLCGDG